MDGQGWRRLTRTANNKFEKFRLNISKRANRD